MQRSVLLPLIIAVLGLMVLGVAVAGGTGRASPPPSRADRVVKTVEEWKSELTAEEFHILRQKGTERAFTSTYNGDHAAGTYTCAGCGLELFSSEHKFDSGTGWPSFWKPVGDNVVDEHVDTAYGMIRTEVTCARCGGHLGHVFRDGPRPTGLRYCINGVSLDKEPTAGSTKGDSSSKGARKTPR